jgi:hypothetical protein
MRKMKLVITWIQRIKMEYKGKMAGGRGKGRWALTYLLEPEEIDPIKEWLEGEREELPEGMVLRTWDEKFKVIMREDSDPTDDDAVLAWIRFGD